MTTATAQFDKLATQLAQEIAASAQRAADAALTGDYDEAAHAIDQAAAIKAILAKCKTCGATFTETKGTIFYRRPTPEDEIIDTLALIAEGNRISSLARTKGHKEDTIIDWIREAGQHAEAIEEVLLSQYQLTRGQIDGLWAYVGNKGEKKPSRD